VNNGLSVMIEGLVAVLLLLTIAYCMMLNKRLKRLKADEQTLKATISELITATEIAERAITGLKVTVQECNTGLGQRLRSAEQVSGEIARQISAGTDVVNRLAQIVSVTRPPDAAGAVSSIAPAAGATVAAAQAFAARARLRTSGQAA
jgi:chromosome segregation ATPase